MVEPKRNLGRAGLAIGAVVVLAGAGALALQLARPSRPAPVEQAKPVVVVQAEDAVPTLIEKLPLPPPALGRDALLGAAAVAANAYAAGAPAPAGNATLVGRAFTLRLPFGCAAAADPVATWTYNVERKTVKFSAQPNLWGKAPWVRTLAGDTPFDAVEGFWVQRPWTQSKACPAAPADAVDPAAPAPKETLGLAQFFAPGASRTRQRGTRPYEFTRKYEGEGTPPGHEYQLVLSGRLAAFADGQPVRCWSESSWLRPRCLIAAELTRVAFEDPAIGETLAEWRD